MTLTRRQHAQGFDRITSLTNVCFECVLELNQQKPQIICFEYVKLTLNEDFLLLFFVAFYTLNNSSKDSTTHSQKF